MKNHLKLVMAAALATSVCAANAGDITGKITLSGTPPKNRQFSMDPTCGGLHKVNRHEMPFYVVAKDSGLRDVVVTLKGVKGKSQGQSAAPVMIDQVGCFYFPYVAVAQTGQTITVKNSDALMHNVHPTPKNTAGGNMEKNLAQPIKGMKNDFKFPAAERFLRFKCDVHPWMFSYVTIEDHPWIAVTAADGTFTIKNVPPGEYEVEAIHRKVHASLEGDVKKVKVTASGAKVDFTLKVP